MIRTGGARGVRGGTSACLVSLASVTLVVGVVPRSHDPGALAAAFHVHRPNRSTAGAREYEGFGDPEPVSIDGYDGSAMEPFLTPDGDDLLFNTSNVAPDVPALEYATPVDTGTFDYQGPVTGANDPGFLSATPSMDDDGNLYFVSTRSYSQNLSTVYTGQFADGTVSAVHVVSGVSPPAAGTVDFDADVSPEGSALYVSVGQFDGASAPTSAKVVLYDQDAGGFEVDPSSTRILRSVNRRGMLDYAADISASGLELFFTRARPSGGTPAIYRAVRRRVGAPFRSVQRVAAITGFAEAPSLSADGTTLYYHELVGDQYDVEFVTRSSS